MATRRRGAANLDDLKAKLGYAEPQPDPEPEVAAPAPDVGAAPIDEVQPTRPAATAPAEGVQADEDLGAEDYSEAVSHLESASTADYDPHAVDPSIKAPRSGHLLGALIGAVIALIVGLAFGSIGVANNTVRSLENATVDDARAMLEIIQPIAAKLEALNTDLAAIPAEAGFQSEFEDHIRAAYGEARPVLDPALVSASRTLVVRNQQLGRSLIDFALATSLMAELADRHLRATENELEEIIRIQQGEQDQRNYAIAFELETQLANFQTFIAAPDGPPFRPIAAERVTYESLEPIIEGEGDERREFYEVTNSAGRTMRVLIHDILLIDGAQLLPPRTGENALDRYRVRAAALKESLVRVAAMQTGLISELEGIAESPKYFTF